MKNTLENKAKFFAQYWGQKVYCYDNHSAKTVSQDKYIDNVSPKHYLELTPLSDITDEDALWVGRDANEFNNSYSDDLKYSLELIARMETNPHLIDFKQSDFLRSKGYALPWMGVSVEQMVEYGWVKLKTLNK